MSTEQIVFPVVSEIEDFFFEAALATYAGDWPKTTISGLPRSKVYRFDHGCFLYIDTYFTNGEYSGGQTVIYFKEKPVWLMQYHGWCKNDDPEVLAFLKEVLRTAYERKVFYGGRGPASFTNLESSLSSAKQKRLIYFNHDYDEAVHPIQHGSFHRFIGNERIESKTPYPQSEIVFWHRYQGILLIPVKEGESN